MCLHSGVLFSSKIQRLPFAASSDIPHVCRGRALHSDTPIYTPIYINSHLLPDNCRLDWNSLGCVDRQQLHHQITAADPGQILLVPHHLHNGTSVNLIDNPINRYSISDRVRWPAFLSGTSRNFVHCLSQGVVLKMQEFDGLLASDKCLPFMFWAEAVRRRTFEH